MVFTSADARKRRLLVENDRGLTEICQGKTDGIRYRRRVQTCRNYILGSAAGSGKPFARGFETMAEIKGG